MIGQNASGEDKWGSVAQGTQQDATTGNPSPSAMQAYTRQYAYDKMGNIEQLKQTVGNTFTRNFKYNDSGSNILHSIKKADDITSYSDFTYDVNGNRLTAGTSRNYVWDYADQLKSYYNQTGTSEPSTYAQYLYSGGQRVKKLVRNSGGGADTTVYIDGVFEHRYNSANDKQNLIHAGGMATVRIGDNFGDDVYNSSLTQDACYKLSNHLGSVSFRTRSSGSKVDVEEYYPFGDSSLRTWSKKKYRYVGKEKDQESGLYYYGARYYAAWTCRFISVDPLAGNYPHLTSYNYASNAPINHLDVDGMQNPDEDIFNPSYSGGWDVKTGYNDTDNTGVNIFIDFSKQDFSNNEEDSPVELKSIKVTATRVPWYERVGNWFKENGATLASALIDFVPGVGTVKGWVEAITGEDLITGEKLSTLDRILNLIPGTKMAKGAGKLMGMGATLINKGVKNRKIKKTLKKARKKTPEPNKVDESAGSKVGDEQPAPKRKKTKKEIIQQNKKQGDEARDEVAKKIDTPVVKEKPIDTRLGKRIIDIWDEATKTAIEVKTGRVGLTTGKGGTEMQLTKDFLLLMGGDVKHVQWQSVVSAQTGKSGYTKNFIQKVNELNKTLIRNERNPIKLL